jgi:two-component system, chemotaxis family, CheB/CheR fusion protein
MHPPNDPPRPDSEDSGSHAGKAPATTPASAQEEEFFVVGIGASAGALEPISEILKQLPRSSEFAAVLVQHLDPNHESILVELLNRVTSMPVQWAMNGRAVEPGHVYVAPPKSCLSIQDGVLVLHEADRVKVGGDVDHFFSALAQDGKHRAVAVILSGNGSDGTAGAKAIKGAGGIVFAQEPSTASFSSMPRSAIDAGCVDRVLAPAAIADELLKLTRNAPLLWDRIAVSDEALPTGTEAEHLVAILHLLTARTGVDFTAYKPTTIKRRLVRQMVLSKRADVGDYLKLLQKNKGELDKLYESLLINVTEFFRDAPYFEFLREQVLPKMIQHRPDHQPIRVWVPGCSTGEEVYSLAILVRELIEESSHMLPVQIFGTDVSDQAISAARAGLYSASDVANVTPERLNQFFHRTDRGYVIQKAVRDMCIFARQNVARDSPFSRLDLISCRNLLIYFGPTLQRKLMPVFHYSLNPGGILVLGSSESVGGHADLFRLVDRRFRIYSRKSSGQRPHLEFAVEPAVAATPALPKAMATMTDELKEPGDIIREADRIVLNRHSPSGVLVNDDLDIVQFRGDVSAYLAPTSGRASLNLFRMARDGLAGELQAAINEAREKTVRVHRRQVPIISGDDTKLVHLDITPIDTAQTRERFYLILFEPVDHNAPERASPETPAKAKRAGQLAQVEQLRQDLEATRTYLQSAIQKHESTNQELRAANEEIQSSNEELQSTNEELETAKEELQSTNEELTTVNEELHSRQLELIQVNNDLHNLINSVHVPIIILDQDLRIRRFTPMAEKVLNVIPTDIGRPLSDININLSVEDLPRLITEVTESLTVKELEVQDREGRWYSMRLRPYRTADQKIDGVVLTLFEIDTIKRTLSEAEEARNLAQAVIETTREPLAALTADLKIKSANDAFYRLFKTTKEHAEGHSFFDLVKSPGKLDGLKQALEDILPTNACLTNHEVGIDLPEAGPTALIVNVRQIASAVRTYPLILLSLRPR